MKDTTLHEQVATILETDKRVADFSIAEINGEMELALTLSESWVIAERTAAHATLVSNMLKKWQMVYDGSYRSETDAKPPNFDAWISSFTGEAISEESMQVWLDDAVALMRSVPHRRVIELGCGVGLVASALAPGGESYFGLDLSGEAITSLKTWANTRPELSHLQLAQGAAHDLEGFGIRPYSADLAVMNSVIQYFPDAAYLKRVLATLAGRLVEGGAIFLGDLRASALLPLRATSAAATQAHGGATVASVRKSASALLGLAREFAIDPAFLSGLAGTLPRLGAITFSLKPEAVDHELSGYRYDAILHLDKSQEPAAPATVGGSLDDLLARIDKERPAAICFVGISNKRLVRDVAFARALSSAAPERLMSSLDIDENPSAVEPHAIAAAAKLRGYSTELRFTPGSPEGCFDALLRRPGERAAWPDSSTFETLTNDPLGEELFKKLRRELQNDLDVALGDLGRARIRWVGLAGQIMPEKVP